MPINSSKLLYPPDRINNFPCVVVPLTINVTGPEFVQIFIFNVHWSPINTTVSIYLLLNLYGVERAKYVVRIVDKTLEPRNRDNGLEPVGHKQALI